MISPPWFPVLPGVALGTWNNQGHGLGAPSQPEGHQRSCRPALPRGPHTEGIVTANLVLLLFCLVPALQLSLESESSVQQPSSPAPVQPTALCRVWWGWGWGSQVDGYIVEGSVGKLTDDEQMGGGMGDQI